MTVHLDPETVAGLGEPTRLTFEDWKVQFQPVPNNLLPDQPYDGLMFETYGADLSHINVYLNDQAKRLHIWTLLEEDGVIWITNGYHFVNRQGYFITEIPFEDGRFIEIMIDDGSDNEEDEDAEA
jgi:hypothetical protein